MDPVIAVAVFSFLGVVVTALAGVFVSIITNRKEKRQTSETTMERTLRERLTLRDEQLEDIKSDLAEELEVNEVLRLQNANLKEAVERLEEALEAERRQRK